MVLALLFAFGLATTLTAATSASGSHNIMGRVEASQLPELAQSSAISNLAPQQPAANGVPMPDHLVIVMEENHSYSEIVGSPSAPYINSLIPQGALFTQSFAITHPSQPNYADLFSGSNQGVTDDSCPHSWTTANLGRSLLNASRSFAGYSEDLPFAGYTGCASGRYVRRHAPWINFTNVPTATTHLPFTAFPTNYTTLPTLSFVIPNLLDDMHDGSIQQGDTWLQQHLNGYAQWAKTHNSLFVLTFDEDDHSQSNQIATIFVGQMVVAGQYSEMVNHFNMLRTFEDMYNLPYAGVSGNYSPITDVWVGAPPTSTGTSTATPTITATQQVATTTSTRTPVGTSTNTPTRTATPTRTNTPVITLTPTMTTATSTRTRTPIGEPTRTGTPTRTPVGTSTNTPTRTAVSTSTSTPARTPTGSPTGTSTGTVTPTRTNTPTNTPIGEPTRTGTPTRTPTKTPVGTSASTPRRPWTAPQGRLQSLRI